MFLLVLSDIFLKIKLAARLCLNILGELGQEEKGSVHKTGTCQIKIRCEVTDIVWRLCVVRGGNLNCKDFSAVVIIGFTWLSKTHQIL